MAKRTVTIALVDDNEVVRYRQTDDCYVCPYDTGDKFTEHNILRVGASTLGLGDVRPIVRASPIQAISV